MNEIFGIAFNWTAINDRFICSLVLCSFLWSSSTVFCSLIGKHSAVINTLFILITYCCAIEQNHFKEREREKEEEKKAEEEEEERENDSNIYSLFQQMSHAIHFQQQTTYIALNWMLK